MKIGIDYHGVIDQYPDIFSNLTKIWAQKNHEIHIITGKEWSYVQEKLIKYNITYDKYFSIVDYHKSIGTNMIKKINGYWLKEDVWNKSKGNYCKKEGINVHFDNDDYYLKWFPINCTCILVRKTGFNEFCHIFKDI